MACCLCYKYLIASDESLCHLEVMQVEHSQWRCFPCALLDLINVHTSWNDGFGRLYGLCRLLSTSCPIGIVSHLSYMCYMLFSVNLWHVYS